MPNDFSINKPRLNGELLGHIFGVIGPAIYSIGDPLRIEHLFMTTSRELGTAIMLAKRRRSYKMKVGKHDVRCFIELASAGIVHIDDVNRRTGRSVDSSFFVETEKIELAKKLLGIN